MSTLLVIIPDRLSVLVEKGEITERYYNPGNLFDEIHILAINADKVDSRYLMKTVGRGKLHLHNLPFTRKDMLLSAGLHPWALARWAKPGVDLARSINPQLVRCHGDFLNTFVAYRIKKELGIPYVVSLHTTREDDLTNKAGLSGYLIQRLFKPIRKLTLRAADKVLPVYQAIVPFLERLGVTKVEVVYNVINPKHLRQKTDYSLHHPVALLYVGRINENKNPENIIRALKQLPSVHLTVIGDGPFRKKMVQVVSEAGLRERVRFIQAISNDQLCEMLPEFDIFAIQTNHSELPKTVLEALLTGLPTIVNKRPGRQVPEFQGTHVLVVANSPSAYAEAIRSLVDDPKIREEQGKRGFTFARANWAPEITEAKYVNIYKEILAQ